MRFFVSFTKEKLAGWRGESGIALLLTMFALALISVLGLIMTMNATMEVRISDNSGSHAQAVLAAISGLDHARVAVRGLDFNALLQGPDGVYDAGSAYMAEAKSFGFRLPFSVLSAQTLRIESPLVDIAGASDDGIINTGARFGIHGTALIPREGIALWADDPTGAEPLILSRYFVKVTDNNGEASELAGDAANNPFIDGDGIIIVRSVGVSRTLTETAGKSVRRNSVAVFESRLLRAPVWDLGPALNILGTLTDAVFTGSPEISGGQAAGIGVLNTSAGIEDFPEPLLLETSATEKITGGGLPAPSIRDISAEARNDRNKSMLFNADKLKDFIGRRAAGMADMAYEGDLLWTSAGMPFLGFYDKAKPWNDPEQKPHAVLVNGNLAAPDGLSGAGVLIVTGKLECAGTMDYRGLIIVLGEGRLALNTDGPGISGGVVTGKLIDSGTGVAFGTPNVAIGGFTRITADKELVRMALRLFPVEQISFREISGSDP
ncbi:MAG: pilus assembly PilX N-terminal domain-containing protein [Acidobacteriota bacterium]|nr:pilus assembly PilX N-terminal domain-containing protein [Acidobacteriota bacterium]